MKIQIPRPAEYILHTLESCGYEAYTVGGCVRDSLLGRTPNDWDICTSATPEQIIEAFPHRDIIPTGLQHGTVTIPFHHVPYEITTYRIDGTYSDNRRPDSVSFTTSLKEDLLRRDFTINAMAYSDTRGLADPYNGQQDLKDQIIRCVGNADERFNEDGLRILRALRFSAQLGFSIEEETSKSILRNRHLLANIAQERIHTELTKALSSKHPALLFSSYPEVVAQIIPEFEPCFVSVWEQTIKALEQASEDLIVRWAILFQDIAKPVSCISEHSETGAQMANTIMRRLKFDNHTRTNAVQLIRYHDTAISPDEIAIKKLLNILGEEQMRRLFQVKRAGNPETAELDQALLIFDKIINENQCYSLKQLALTGKDLIQLGCQKGTGIGEELNHLLTLVINNELENTPEALTAVVLHDLQTNNS